MENKLQEALDTLQELLDRLNKPTSVSLAVKEIEEYIKSYDDDKEYTNHLVEQLHDIQLQYSFRLMDRQDIEYLMKITNAPNENMMIKKVEELIKVEKALL